MSFAHDCKDELCLNNELTQMEQSVELEALLRLNSSIVRRNNITSIAFETATASVAKRFLMLIKNLYHVESNLYQKIQQISHTPLYVGEIVEQAEAIIDEYNLLFDMKTKDYIESEEILTKAYLRAAFLAKGSVNDSKKADYHLEICTKDSDASIFIQHLMNNFDFNAKISKRRDDYVIYLKESGKIIDFLRIIGVNKNVFIYEGEIIKRSVSSDVAKKLNCEIANEVKTLEAGKEQLKYITYLEYNYPLEEMDPKILLIMKVRKDHPEATFKELIQILNDEYGEKITKSGLNHRFIKIKELAKKLHDELDEK